MNSKTIARAKKIIASENGKKGVQARIKKHGSISEIMSKVRKGKKFAS